MNEGDIRRLFASHFAFRPSLGGAAAAMRAELDARERREMESLDAQFGEGVGEKVKALSLQTTASFDELAGALRSLHAAAEPLSPIEHVEVGRR
ncbi:hypothetical protein [Engelhardtia mirabilis]|uniref:Uncharacterized protein n=1 Tax=Engelhardtia mirabilis TaxID=2528011 RepID=A0A518BL30_9BACT|nr:hypothetical protein Pla133_27720 [Planctomycetes bacterium Pla133]QDV02010.1 hypothetical protein Pla86_27710 [Planctomycetes bacterium Pla86]